MHTITLVTIENISIQISLKKHDQTIRVAMIGNVGEQQIKVYWNNECQIFPTQFPSETMDKLILHYLPKIAADIQNIAVWKYSLSEDHIHRLFTYGLFYVAVDYQQLQEHRKRMNTFSFTQKQFSDKVLIPFDEPFDENIWETKKKQVNQDEVKYFSTDEPTTIELLGNKTFLVIEKTAEPWLEYTIILDVSIANWPIHGEQLILVTLNGKSKVSVTHEGKLRLKAGETKTEGNLTLNTNEYFRLWISVKEESIKIFINGQLQIDLKTKDDQFLAQSDRFYLFKEKDLTKNIINENTVRIRCQSITFLSRSTTSNEEMQTPNCSLQSLVTPPLSIIVPSLIAIGHKLEWIQSVIDQYKTTKHSLH